MIPFGPWHPDKAGLNASVCLSAVNCIPGVNGFRPLRSPAASSSALAGECIGAAVVFDDVGAVATFAGDATDLYRLDASSVWAPVSRTSGGAYNTGSGERWQFEFSGGLVLAVTISEEPQKYLLGTSTNFEPLGGTPPKARYIATVGDFIVLAGLFQDERTVRWSGLANPEHWTPGTLSSDYQTFQNGGPVRGVVGGEVGYVFQAESVTRMTFVPGSDVIFQFDQVEGGRGLAAPYSLVKLGNDAFYLASDGFYKFSLGGGSSTPLGVGKWSRWLVGDLKSGTEGTVLGGVDPVGRYIVWAYNSNSNPNSNPNRMIIYDWALDEATTAELSVTTLAQILTKGVALEDLDAYGNLDTLPYSLDSPLWRGGSSVLGMFQDDAKLAFMSGLNLSATFVTGDGGMPGRTLIKGLRPHIDTRSITAAIAAREAEGDNVSFGPPEPMADTGVIPAWASGFVARARLVTEAGAVWEKYVGHDTVKGGAGNR